MSVISSNCHTGLIFMNLSKIQLNKKESGICLKNLEKWLYFSNVVFSVSYSIFENISIMLVLHNITAV